MKTEDDEAERKFLLYQQDLLKSRKQVSLKGKPPTRSTLKEVLKNYCNILARWTHVESVTIHLKIYDQSIIHSQQMLKDRIQRPVPSGRDTAPTKYIDSEYSEGALSDSPKRPHYRDDPLWSSLAFPFSALPRGGLQLVACNDDSPWRVFLPIAPKPANENERESDDENDSESDDEDERQLDDESEGQSDIEKRLGRYSIVRLSSGVSAEIIQDNIARRRGRASMLAARSDQKLGFADALVWTNHGVRGIFRNYFGVPIRLHSDGEVIGILKLENKIRPSDDDTEAGPRKPAGPEDDAAQEEGTGAFTLRKFGDQLIALTSWNRQITDREFGIDLLIGLVSRELGSDDAEPLIIREPWSQMDKLLADQNLSILALAYLKADLEQARKCIGAGKEPMATDLFPSYPHVDRLLLNDNMTPTAKSLLPPGKEPPPLQLWAATQSAEQWLCRKLIGARTDRPSIRSLLDEFAKVRQEIEAHLRHPPTETSAVMKLSQMTFHVDNRHSNGKLLPLFTYRLSTEERDEAFEFFAMIPPQIGDENAVAAQQRNIFWAINPEWAPTQWQAPVITEFNYRGERVVSVTVQRKDGSHERIDLEPGIPDLRADRLAARAQALVHSVPIPNFESVDSEKLTFLAHEVANFVRLEIVYRGNRHAKPMPLTDEEFDRLPISDPSFVDDLRGRVIRADAVKPNIDHHIHNLLSEWSMSSTVRYRSRLKEYDSHLDRLAARYDGYMRGSLGVWFFLLGGLVRDEDGEACPLFCQRMRDFAENVSIHAPSAQRQNELLTKSNLETMISTIQEWNQDEAPFAELGFFSWPWLDDLGAIDGREPWKIVAQNLELVGRHEESDFRVLVQDNALPPRSTANCVLRNHEPYVLLASSLLVQLYESRPAAPHPEYRHFYRTLFELRRLLSVPLRDILDLPRLAGLKQIFVDQAAAWADMVNYVATHSTGEFLKECGESLLQSDDDERARLSAPAIYKRLRTLLYRMREQHSTAHLEWQFERFDLFGCQLNCLYKNQVAALYEEIWDRGDPFRGRIATPKWTPGSRARWVCLRTNVHRGGYNALQVAALVDASAVRRGFWETTPGPDNKLPQGAVYNLSLLQLYWSHCFRRLTQTNPSFRERYCHLAKMRHEWVREYVPWFQRAEKLARNRAGAKPPGSFDIFFGGVVVDLALWALGKLGEHMADPHLHNYSLNLKMPTLGTELGQVIKSARDRLTVDADNLLGSDWPSWLNTFETELRGMAEKFYDSAASGFYKELKIWCKTVRNVDQHERDFLRSIGKLIPIEKSMLQQQDVIRRAALGIVFFAHSLSDEDYQSVVKGLQNVSEYELQFRAWERYRRGQKDYLFWLGEPMSDHRAGFRHRDQVLGRLENYTLAWCPELLDAERPCHFDFWNARDLFYYVRSLIPTEIQVRTHLADVLADQYHDQVYKQHPHASSLVPRTRMNQVASQLDDLDRELEIDFEDYIRRES